MIEKIKEKIISDDFKKSLKATYAIIKIPIYVIMLYAIYGSAIRIVTTLISTHLKANFVNNMDITNVDSIVIIYIIPILISLIIFKGAFIIHNKLHYFIFTKNNENIVTLPVNSYVTDIIIKSANKNKDLQISIEKMTDTTLETRGELK